jgi:predicted nucleotidyltransferase
MMTKDNIINKIKPYIENHDHIIAAWEGGSRATGNEDIYSDLDLMIVTDNHQKESVFKTLVDYFDTEYGIERQYRVKEPTWHGFSQIFLKLKGTPDYFYIDMAVMTKDTEDKFISRKRHGHGNIWFDKEGILDDSPLPKEIIQEKGKTLYERATSVDFLFIIETNKYIYRQNFSEAFTSMVRFLQNSASVIFNLEHRPYQVDFGLRYAYKAYPEYDFNLVDSCLKAYSIASLEEAFTALLKRYETLKQKHRPNTL